MKSQGSGASSRRGLVRVLALILFLGLYGETGPTAWSEAPSEYALKAEFIERFTRFVDWPATHVPGGDRGTFTIGIVGDDPFGAHLRRLASSRRIKDRRVEIRKINEVSEIGRCQLLFISDLEQSRLGEILDATRERPILTVGDTPGYAEAGVLINFYLDGDRVRFEINEQAVAESGLQMDARLLKLARVIDRGQQ